MKWKETQSGAWGAKGGAVAEYGSHQRGTEDEQVKECWGLDLKEASSLPAALGTAKLELQSLAFC